MNRIQVIVNCADGHGDRSYGTYVGFEPTEVEALMVGLPKEWSFYLTHE